MGGEAPNLVYTPNTDFTGSDSFTFKVNDGTADSPEASVTLIVAPIQDAPVATAREVKTEEDTTVNIVLAGTDVDEGEQEKLSYAVLRLPTQGGLSGEAPNLVYTPNTDFTGSDSFTFQVNDGAADSPEASVNLTVTPIQDAPVATTQKVETEEDNAVNVVLAGTDVDEGEQRKLSYAVLRPPTQGILSGEAPNLVYTPNANFNGSDSFTFQVNDGTADSPEASVTNNRKKKSK